jgi:ribosome-binding protein aMBF1 (putative translation factor)
MIIMSDFRNYLNEQLKNEEFKTEYEKLEPEFSIIQAVIDARKANHITQQELSDRTGIAQSDISKLENGNSNPTLGMLKRLADGMGMTVKLQFVPKQ